MDVKQTILRAVLDEPGTSRERLCSAFDLSDYRLRRVLRHIERELTGTVLVNHPVNGVWVVEVDSLFCLGMNWMGGVEEGGYRQCGSPPAFPDGRCYEHSEYESLDMVAFLRTLCSVSGPREPTPRSLCQIGLVRVEELLNTLRGISPATRKDFVTKQKLLEILRVAWAILRSRERRARIDRENWIPPEFWARHRRSSMSPFEFSLKKHFQELEVAVDATREEVLKAWKKLCLKFHPDLAGGDEERMKRINLAKDRIFRIRRWH